MPRPAFAVLVAVLALAVPVVPAQATIETEEARATAASAAETARADMLETFGEAWLDNGKFLWKKGSGSGVTRVVISLTDQMAYAYDGDELVGASTISSGNDEKPTPTGIFPILEKKRFHRSFKYDNAPMPFMQRIDGYGVALHGGFNPGYPASHGCIRLPLPFAKKLFSITDVGTPVYIGA